MSPSNFDLHDVVGHEPTVTFAVARVTDHEIVGPIMPKKVQYGRAVRGEYPTEYTIPVLILNFNKYRPDLPPWRQVTETFLASEGGTALATVQGDLIDTSISGRLKTVELGCESIQVGAKNGELIDRKDVMV